MAAVADAYRYFIGDCCLSDFHDRGEGAWRPGARVLPEPLSLAAAACRRFGFVGELVFYSQLDAGMAIGFCCVWGCKPEPSEFLTVV